MTRLFVDFNNADTLGRVRLNTNGTLDDIKRQSLRLHDGMNVQLYSDDDADAAGNPHELSVVGMVSYSKDEKCWVAAINWSEVQSVNLAKTLLSSQNGIVNGTLHRDWLAKKIILCLVVTLLAFIALRSTYFESTVEMGHGWSSSYQITVMGTPYQPVQNPSEEQLVHAKSQVRNSQLLVLGIWAILLVIIGCWRTRRLQVVE